MKETLLIFTGRKVIFKNREAGAHIYCINMMMYGVADEEENCSIYDGDLFFVLSVCVCGG